MTDTLKPKSRLPPITSARDYDNGQVMDDNDGRVLI